MEIFHGLYMFKYYVECMIKQIYNNIHINGGELEWMKK